MAKKKHTSIQLIPAMDDKGGKLAIIYADEVATAQLAVGITNNAPVTAFCVEKPFDKNAHLITIFLEDGVPKRVAMN